VRVSTRLSRVLCSYSRSKRQQQLSPRLLGWLISVFNADYVKIKDINGLDCYFFIRFLRMMVRIMLPIWLVSWAVLLPVTSVHTAVAGHSGLDKFIFGNVAANRQPRYGAHLIVTWISTSKIMAGTSMIVPDLLHPCHSMDLVEYQTRNGALR
jgi:hypothetical protein